MSDVWVGRMVVIICCILGSGGFWSFLRSRDSRRHATTNLMMGLAYIQITTLGVQYLNRGSITKDEFEDFQKYFFEPYKALGGNGVAERIMDGVKNLPFVSHEAHTEIFHNREGWINNVRVVTREEQDAASGR